jgi:sulfur carrier protein
MVTINGKPVAADGKTIAAYLAETDYNVKTIVVEHNFTIVPRENYDTVLLHDHDVVEIVCFMGGGTAAPIRKEVLSCTNIRMTRSSSADTHFSPALS